MNHVMSDVNQGVMYEFQTYRLDNVSISTYNLSNVSNISKRIQDKNNFSSHSVLFPKNRFYKKRFSPDKSPAISSLDIDSCRSRLFDVGYTDTRMAVVDCILRYLTRYAYGYFKMSAIAKEVGCGRTTVETVLRIMKQEGIVVQQRRFYNHKEISSAWHLNDVYRDRSVLIGLSYWFPFLKRFRFSFSLLLILSLSVSNCKAYADAYIQSTGYHNNSYYDSSFKQSEFVPPSPYDFFESGGGGHAPSLTYAEWDEIVGNFRECDMFSQGVSRVRSLVVTDKGKCELSCFSDEALAFADKRLWGQLVRGDKYSPSDAWRYFCKVAHGYSRENDLPINYALASKLCREGGFSLDGPNVESVASPPTTPKTGRRESEQQTKAAKEVPRIAVIRNTVFSAADKEHIQKKIKFFTGALKAAQGSKDATSAKCQEHFKDMLSVWQEKLDSLPVEPESHKEPVMVKEGFVFGEDDAPIGYEEHNEESVWI